jgi:hypothetical protein
MTEPQGGPDPSTMTEPQGGPDPDRPPTGANRRRESSTMTEPRYPRGTSGPGSRIGRGPTPPAGGSPA